MHTFWKWYLMSGRVDGHIERGRRFLLAVVSVLSTGLWLFFLVRVMPQSKSFFTRICTNPFILLAFLGVHLANKAVEYLQYRLAARGEVPPERGAFAQNQSKIFERYKLVFGEDAAFKLPNRLGWGYMACAFVGLVIIFAQGPFER